MHWGGAGVTYQFCFVPLASCGWRAVWCGWSSADSGRRWGLRVSPADVGGGLSVVLANVGGG